MASLDLLVVVVYVVGTTLLGVWLAGRQSGVRSYFVGDRDVSWWLVLVSIVATETSTVTFLSVPGVGFAGNLTFLQLALGYVVGRVLIAVFLLPQYFRGEVFTAYELLRSRFDARVQRTASALFLLTRTVADGLRLYLTALILNQFTGWGMASSVLAMTVVTLFYTYLGGMRAVIWTDLIQFATYTVGAVLAGVVLLHQIPSGDPSVWPLLHDAGKLRVFDFSTDPTRPFTFWAGLIGGAFLTMATHGADQIMVQRYLCARSVGQARLALVLSGVTVLVQFLLFLLIGVGLFVLVQQGGLDLPKGTRNDEVFGLFIVRYLPVGLVGLVIAAVLAAAMSTLSSSLNSSANAVMTDFYRPLRPNRTDGEYLAVSRGLTAFWALAQACVALAALWLTTDRRDLSVVNQVLAVAGFTTGIVLGLFLLGSLPRRVSSVAALFGLGVGFAAVAAVWLPTTAGETLVAWPWYAPIGALTTFVVGFVVDLLGLGDGPSADRGA